MCPLSLWERAGVRGELSEKETALNLPLSRRERGRYVRCHSREVANGGAENSRGFGVLTAPPDKDTPEKYAANRVYAFGTLSQENFC